MKYEIQVTADDIARGKPDSHCACPIALAVCRATGLQPSLCDVSVDPEAVALWDRRRQEWEVLELPAAAREFVSEFDAGVLVLPLAFELVARTEPIQ